MKTPLHQPVAYMVNGAFSEYQVINERQAIMLPDLKKEYVTLLVSGLTAAISLESVAEMKAGMYTVSIAMISLICLFVYL